MTPDEVFRVLAWHSWLKPLCTSEVVEHLEARFSRQEVDRVHVLNLLGWLAERGRIDALAYAEAARFGEPGGRESTQYWRYRFEH